MKDLYILRHGAAGSAEETNLEDDSQRQLTRKGEKRVRKAALGMCAMGIELGLILTSPYARALKTAEIVAEVYGMAGKVIQTEALTPAKTPAAVVEEVLKHIEDHNQIMLVGHEPQLSKLISYLISGFTHASIDLKKSGLCHLAVEKLRPGKCAFLKALYPAKLLEEQE